MGNAWRWSPLPTSTIPKDGRLMVGTVDGDEGLTELLPDLEAHVTEFSWKDDAKSLLACRRRCFLAIRPCDP